MAGKDVHYVLRLVAKLSIDKASQVLSKMVRAGSKIELEKVYLADISKATENVMASDRGAVVGAFVDLVGDIPFKFLFYVDSQDSMMLTDLILRRPDGATKAIDVYTMSAVQELGNILSSAITNVFASDFQVAMKPTPPKMVHDYASTVFQEFLMDAATEQNEILMIESTFRVVKVDIKCRMFLLPKNDAQKTLANIIGLN
ncbi:MAG: chemotaxis protein CheC [Candidatus Omnitrophica bacterium]|nr:chemotaxis protein CheC [Candidatus Omnitrophota bacterium]